MKRCLWTIKMFLDDNKNNLLFRKEYKNIKNIMEDFKLKKSFLYECCEENKYKPNSRKSKIIEKYKRIVIEKKTFDKDNNFVLKTFSI